MADGALDFPGVPDGMLRRYCAWGVALERMQVTLAALGYPIDGPPDAVCTQIVEWAKAGMLPAAPRPAKEV
jgi:hypothetical protein